MSVEKLDNEKLEAFLEKKFKANIQLVLTSVEITDEGKDHETVRVSGKFLAKEFLDSGFTLVLPNTKKLTKLLGD